MLILINTNILPKVPNVKYVEVLQISNGNEFCKYVVIFGVDKSLLVHIDNKKRDILILGKDPTDGLK